ncbi:MAG: cytochrome c oxidase accessory protein CcoG [Planctomycetia bacterium]|nr:cytochrome c oxidase accessory protein CcoG [Planctomycetia bacterium]
MYNKQEIDQYDKEYYRDKISTVDSAGKRVWIYPKKPKGTFYSARTIVAIFLLALLFAGPFITINGHPFLLLDFLGRKFYIFGIVFWPQDLYLFGIALIAIVVFIVLFTSVFGRLFCGWICPQTIFMELIFRKIEYWIEGGPVKQKNLNAAHWNWEKIYKKGFKSITFFVIAFVIGNTLLAYIIGKDELFKIISEPISDHIGGFTAMMIFTLLFFANFMFFREQACTLVCPYGRLQSVLLDENSIVVHYDFIRGEPRGKGKRTRTSKLGDCIDCHQCVDVCPTGIDIRNGTQLECVNCTACIDSCNTIMDKVQQPRGLIRYDSYNNITGGKKSIFNPRVIGYTAVLILLLSVLSLLLASRKPIETTIFRTPGTLYQEIIEDYITNMYNIKVINKSYEKREINLRLVAPSAGVIRLVNKLSLEKNDFNKSVFFIDIPKKYISSTRIPITIEVFSDRDVIETYKTVFMAPLIQSE